MVVVAAINSTASSATGASLVAFAASTLHAVASALSLGAAAAATVASAPAAPAGESAGVGGAGASGLTEHTTSAGPLDESTTEAIAVLPTSPMEGLLGGGLAAKPYSWVIAVLLAALASFVSNLGLNFQKLHHKQVEERRNDPGFVEPNMCTQGRWIVGFLLVLLGSIADFAALSFGPQSLVTPLGSLTLVSNAMFAPFLLGETLSPRRLGGTGLIIAGSIVAVVWAPHDDADYTNEQLFAFFWQIPFVVYTVLLLVVCVCSLLWIKRLEALENKAMAAREIEGEGEGFGETVGSGGRAPRSSGNLSDAELSAAALAAFEFEAGKSMHRFLYPAISGAVGAQSVLFAKCFVELLVNGLSGRGNPWRHTATYFVLLAMSLSIYFQISWINAGLKRYDASYVVPVFQAFWICLSVVGGMVFYHEYDGMSWAQLGLFACGVGLTITGVVVISEPNDAPENVPPVGGRKEPADIETDADGAANAGAGDGLATSLISTLLGADHGHGHAHGHGKGSFSTGNGGGNAGTHGNGHAHGGTAARKGSGSGTGGRDSAPASRSGSAAESAESRAAAAVARVIRQHSGNSDSGHDDAAPPVPARPVAQRSVASHAHASAAAAAAAAADALSDAAALSSSAPSSSSAGATAATATATATATDVSGGGVGVDCVAPSEVPSAAPAPMTSASSSINATAASSAAVYSSQTNPRDRDRDHDVVDDADAAMDSLTAHLSLP